MSSPIAWDVEIDASGLLCPLPVLKARKRLLAMEPGAVLRLVCDDPAALVDIPHFCAEQGHIVLERVEIAHPTHAWLIRRAAARA